MTKLVVFYTPKMVADSGAYSPSAGKPATVVADWLGREAPVELRDFAPATEAQFAAVHDPAYVSGVLYGHQQNGFGNTRTDVALSLPYTSGAMLAAARHAIANPTAPAPCAPVSGFHHAGYGRGAGFCTFNGLMLTARALVAEGLAKRVGVLDADMHYGDGTDSIIRHFEQAFRAGEEPRHPSAWVEHVTFGGKYRSADQAARFLAELPAVVSRMAIRCDVILYQAGADPHVDDPLGGWLTTDQLAERDRIVFETASMIGCPVAWDFAGGYQREADGSIPKVVAVHTNTMRAALAAANGGA